MDEAGLRALLKENAADPAYIELAHTLIDSGRSNDAVEVCLRALSADQFNPSGRLALARAFFELGYIPFAKRELEVIAEESPDNSAVKRLLSLLGRQEETDQTSDAEQDVAEVEFDVNEFESLK